MIKKKSHARHSSHQCDTNQEHLNTKTVESNNLSNSKSRNCIFNFLMNRFVSPSTSITPSPMSLQPHTRKTNDWPSLFQELHSFITCAIVVITLTNQNPLKWMIQDKIHVGFRHLKKDKQLPFHITNLKKYPKTILNYTRSMKELKGGVKKVANYTPWTIQCELHYNIIPQFMPLSLAEAKNGDK